MQWLAIDIGGANLKVADGAGFASSSAFPLWLRAEQLAVTLRTLMAEAPPSDHLAVTMTGELADCFPSRAEGVRFILKAVGEAASSRHTRVYLNNGKMVTPQVALADPLLAASSNWHALARFAGRYAKQGTALLLDIGSTSCDVIPLQDGTLLAGAQTDMDRLLQGQLVYTGVQRSPVCALVATLPFRGESCPVAQEVFATTYDVYLLLGNLPEDLNDKDTADHRPATKGAARTRLGRMVCAVEDQFNHRDAAVIADAVAEAQVQRILAAVERVGASLPSAPGKVIISGHGEFLARRVVASMSGSPEIISLSKELGLSVSRCAPAHALAVLAKEAAGL